MPMEQQKLNTMDILSDILCAVGSMCFAFWLRFVVFQGENPVGGFQYHLLWATLFSPVYVLIYGLAGIYNPHCPGTPQQKLGRLISCNTIAMMLYINLIFVFRVVDFSRWMLVIAYVVMNLLTVCKRHLIDRYRQRRARQGLGLKRLILVGDGATALHCLEKIRQQTPPEYQVLGNLGQAGLDSECPHLGRFDDVHTVIDRTQPDELLIALGDSDFPVLKSILLACENSGVKLTLLPVYHEYMSDRPFFERIAGLSVINVRRIALDNYGLALVKRSVDVVLSLLMILVTSPLMLAAAVGTKLSSPGPVIFRQERIGKDRKPFQMYKFRSMRINDRQDSGWTTEGDPRRTRFGAFMRRYSIDELPQLFNVLKGDMSLVGPRPEIPHYVDHFKYSIPLYMVRHQVRPGMTGWAQVNGLRGDTSIADRVDYDLYYIENWSLLLDIKILLMTPFKGIVNPKETLTAHEAK